MACVQCQVFGSGELLDQVDEFGFDKCSLCPPFKSMFFEKAEELVQNDERLCTLIDDDDCHFTFVYGYKNETEKLQGWVQEAKECPDGTSPPKTTPTTAGVVYSAWKLLENGTYTRVYDLSIYNMQATANIKPYFQAPAQTTIASTTAPVYSGWKLLPNGTYTRVTKDNCEYFIITPQLKAGQAVLSVWIPPSRTMSIHIHLAFIIYIYGSWVG